MKRFVLTFNLTLTLLTSMILGACDAEDAGQAEAQAQAQAELDLLVETQLEDAVGSDLVCEAWPELDSVLDDELADHELLPCLAWTDAAPDLDLRGPMDQVPTGTIWQETKYVETYVACGANPNCKIGNVPCCRLALKYVRTCTMAGCGEWVYIGSECGCG